MSEVTKEISWELITGDGAAGTGDWKHFPPEFLSRVFDAAKEWKQQISGVEKPWLCWCVDEEWCWYQQQLVHHVGWTPVVGTDGRFARPRLHERAVFVDFNRELCLPLMWMHFPVEFMYLYCDKLAFWHSDVLIPLDKLNRIVHQFESLQQGETAAVDMTRVGLGTAWRRYRKGRPPFFRRYFEVVACTTANASEDQFRNGASWWKHPERHPNFRSDLFRQRPHFDHGVGIWLWKKYFRGKVRPLETNVHPFHYSTNHPLYDRHKDSAGRLVGSKHNELARSFNLNQIVTRLGLTGD